MAIDRPGAIEPHPRRSRRAAAQRRTAGQTFCLARGMPSAGVPAPRGGPAGEKSGGRRCGQTIEAEPALGQISPSEVRVARPERAQGDVAAIGCMTQEDERTARKDLRWRTNGGAASSRRYCRPDDRRCGASALSARIAFMAVRLGERLWADERREEMWEKRTDLRRVRGREARTMPEPKEAERFTQDVGLHNRARQDRYESACPPGRGSDPAPPVLRNIPGRNCDRRLMILSETMHTPSRRLLTERALVQRQL